MSDEPWPIDVILTHYGWELPTLHGSGWQKVRCHEHDDTHASATVNLELGAAKCFGCDFHGDAIAIIMRKEGCGYREAVRFAEEITGRNDGPVRNPGRARGRIPRRAGDSYVNRRYVPSWRRRDTA